MKLSAILIIFFDFGSLNFLPYKINTKPLEDIFVSTQTAEEAALAILLVDVLDLEDVEANEIDPEEMLFGDGLGLDSIDALEIALGIAQEYGVEIKAEDEGTKEAFATLRSLSAYVESHK